METVIDINSITFMSNPKGNYSLAGYDEIITQAVEAHLSRYDHYSLMKKGLAIILLSTTFKVYQKPVRGDKLKAKINEGGISGVCLRENIRIYKGDKLVIEAATFFGLLNFITRKLCKNIGDYFVAANDETNLKATSKTDIEEIGEKVGEVIIKPSYLDALNHCNNQRYYEFIYDFLDKKQQSMNDFSKIEMYYLKEAKLNDVLSIYRKDINDKVYFYGLKENGEYSFKALLEFNLKAD